MLTKSDTVTAKVTTLATATVTRTVRLPYAPADPPDETDSLCASEFRYDKINANSHYHAKCPSINNDDNHNDANINDYHNYFSTNSNGGHQIARQAIGDLGFSWQLHCL
jgi:hypothetical protein